MNIDVQIDNMTEQLEVLKAFKDGKAIEFRLRQYSTPSGRWNNASTPRWNWTGCEYRIKPDSIPLCKVVAFKHTGGAVYFAKEGSKLHNNYKINKNYSPVEVY